MSFDVLGRTNRSFPPIWLSLSAPLEASDPGSASALVEAAVVGGVPIDITSSPALWGSALRTVSTGPEAFVTKVGILDYALTTDDRHAADVVQADLIQTLSALGRETLDIYFLPVMEAPEEFQIGGALEAIEAARHEGHIRYTGLCCRGNAYATLNAWNFHDAFEVLLVKRNHLDAADYAVLSPVARERRVGVVTYSPLNWGYGLPFFRLPGCWRLGNLTQSFYGQSLAQAVLHDLSRDCPVMVGVRDAKEAEAALAATVKSPPEGLVTMLDQFRAAWQNDAEWQALSQSESPRDRQAAARRLRELVR